ncbi:MAG: pitrilysin family protein, partial [Victivallaceae bacterium]
MLRNPKQPTVAVVTAIHAGSVDDPPQSTGLAHYFEHLMFKGSNRIGTVNYEKEHRLLDQIEDLFEQQRKSSDPTERTEIYKKIDLLSQEAATYAAPGEYSQLVNTLGGTGVNAMTSYTGTVYICEIPANELSKMLQLEAERFSQPVLRLFQTELETVYEEFNTSQDSDDRRAFEALVKNAYGPLHPYGRSVIGLPEHLKNPSMRDIYTFAKRYYVPANMKLIIIGDIDYQKTLELVNKYFNNPMENQPNQFNSRKIMPPENIAPNQKITVSGPAPAQVLLGFRISANKRNELLCDMLELALNDSGSGILEENLLRNQQLQGAFAASIQTGDEILFILGGRPQAGQNLTQVAELLKDQLQFMGQKPVEKWRLTAAADNFRLKQLDLSDSNLNNAINAAFCFTDDKSYAEFIRRPEDLLSVTPEELQNFVAQVVLKSPLIEVDKIQGAPDALTKIPKPPLTPIEINRSNQSEYAKTFIAAPNDGELPADFLADLKNLEHYEFTGTDLKSRDLLYPAPEVSSQGELFYLRNLYDDRFTLEIVVDSGKLANPALPLMTQFMEFAAPAGMSAVEFRRELYKRTLTLDFSCNNYTTTMKIRGLNKYLPDAVEFVTKLLNTGYADEQTIEKFRNNILKQRSDAKQTPP